MAKSGGAFQSRVSQGDSAGQANGNGPGCRAAVPVTFCGAWRSLDSLRLESSGRGRGPDMDVRRSTANGDRRFDMITLLNVFEHLTDPVRVLSRLSPVLASDGVRANG